MKDIIKDLGLDDKTFPAKYVLSVISKEKDRMVTPQEMLDRAEAHNDYKLLPIAKAYKRYQTRLKENNAVDFDDIILLTVKLLQEHEDVRFYYQQKFRYVLVDEYQDTNHLQYLLTSLLAGGYENICVVGDDDQSIYRFRGATIENILSFEKQYRGSRVIRLEQNYRSTQSILNAANAVIAHNIGRKGKRLWTANGEGRPITLYEADSESTEANYVASQILAGSKKKGFRSHAILYQLNLRAPITEEQVAMPVEHGSIQGRRFQPTVILHLRQRSRHIQITALRIHDGSHAHEDKMRIIQNLPFGNLPGNAAYIRFYHTYRTRGLSQRCTHTGKR